jgi:hypothetical protein
MFILKVIRVGVLYLMFAIVGGQLVFESDFRGPEILEIYSLLDRNPNTIYRRSWKMGGRTIGVFLHQRVRGWVPFVDFLVIVEYDSSIENENEIDRIWLDEEEHSATATVCILATGPPTQLQSFYKEQEKELLPLLSLSAKFEQQFGHLERAVD